ncbi:MAG: transglutaminase TgpA family protein [bacterium]
MVGWERLARGGRPEHSIPLRVWTLAAVAVSVFAVTAHDDFWRFRLIVPILVIVGFAFSFWRRGRPGWWVKVALALLCLQVGWKFLWSVAADPYHTSIPLTILLLWLQTLHSFDVPARRDLLFSLLSSVILMAVAAAFAQDLTYLLYLAAYTVPAVQALVHNAWQTGQDAVVEGQVRRQPAGPGAPWRVLALAANHFLVVVVLVAAVIFVLTPRFGGIRVTSLPFSPQPMLLDLFAGRLFNPAYPAASGDRGAAPPPWNSRGYFGFSPTVDLRLRGRLDDTIVMRVRATHLLNWRALVFDTYTGTGWEISDRRLAQYEGSPPMTLVHDRDDVFSYAARPLQVTQTFHIEQEQPNVVFAAALVEQLYVPTGRIYRDRYGSIRLPGTLKPGMVYSVISRALVPDAARLRGGNGLVPRHLQDRYLSLPPLPERVGALAQALTSEQPTVYDRVMAINTYLWQHYRYDLSIPPQRRSGDAVDYFLFEERRGYCEQFASAMVVLLRSAGIPARLVTGYTSGTLNPVTGLLEVRNSDAHAWVEAFFPGVGWVEFEPTPGFLETAALGGPTLGRWVWQDIAAWLRSRTVALASGSPHAATLAALAAAVRAGVWVGLVLVGAVAVASIRRARAGRSTRVGRISALVDIYNTMCAVLARTGLRRDPSETVGEYRRRVEDHRDLPEVGALSGVIEAVAYGGIAPDAALVQTARVHLDGLRMRLKGHGARR